VTEPEVTPLAPGDAESAGEAAALLNQELGDGLYRPEWLLEDAANPRAGVWVARAPALVGVAVARLLMAADHGYYRAFGPEDMARLEGGVGSFEALAVDPALRHRGLGTGLTSVSLDWMRAQGCDTAVTLSWRSNRNGSAGLFRRMGMREGTTVERFYHEESLRDGWACPVCHGPCTCPATLFTLPLATPPR
jgi:ribosomal protein S18 acetylase RimI-like enzyme